MIWSFWYGPYTFNVLPQGIFVFYNLQISSLPEASSSHLPTSLPEGVQFVLNTLPVRRDKLFSTNMLTLTSKYEQGFIHGQMLILTITMVLRLMRTALEMVMALLLMLP